MAMESYSDEERVDTLEVTASVIETARARLRVIDGGAAEPDSLPEADALVQTIRGEINDDPERVTRAELASQLLDEVLKVTATTGWDIEDFACLLGCEYPDPDTWLHVDVGALDQSVKVVSLMRERMERCVGRSTQWLEAYLRESLGDDEKTRHRIEQARDLLAVAEQRTAARESVMLSIELLSRVRGRVESARQILDDIDSDESTSNMIARDQFGAARSVAVNAIRRRTELEAGASTFRFVQITRDELIAQYGQEAVEQAEKAAAGISRSPEPQPGDDFTSEQIRTYTRRTRRA